jgi:hypothetical protein
MSWGKLDDGWDQHPKLLAAGLIARAIQSNAIAYCARYMTDGYLATEALPHLFTGVELLFVKNGGGSPTAASAIDWAAVMVANGLWDKVEGRPGQPYKVHDYLDYNRCRVDLLAERLRNKTRGEVAARARWDRWQTQQNHMVHASSNALSIGPPDAPTRPVPSTKYEGSLTVVDKINPLVSGQPREVQEGDAEARASAFYGKPIEELSFDDFMTYYPIQVGVDAARRAYKRVTRGTPDVKRAIFSALAAQLGWGKKFWPNPARWFTEGRWKDQPPRGLETGSTPQDDQVGRAQVRALVAGLAKDLAFTPLSGRAASKGEGRNP